MGGCGSAFEECNSSTCAGHSVDVVHFKLETTIPGRLYGGNAVDNANFTGDDRFGHLSDSYGYNPRCRFLDGTSRHPALAEFRPKDAPFGLVGAHGDYIFEFSRPLRTSDRLLQDAQLSIGQRHLFSAAIWYPTGDGRSPWTAEGHYVPSCNWMILELWQGQEPLGGWLTDSQASIEETSSKWLAVLSLLFALVAVGVSIAVGSYVQKHSRHFQHVNPNNL
ncbi:hypothetical protein CBR_g51501 [Chara braunii]|uniref:Uncharacterized protein n=1 Tax=Chara braunii TaxID=69332 RepID=A0A388K6D6_CHABU|nr:hypothetical protein CBR_g51501 [Chara braunii]|eukprot:GBG65618.1 hypothetical protein CBR_g51501 [Chara braunii]